MSKTRKFTDVLDRFLQDEQFAADFLSQALQEKDFDVFFLSIKDIVRVHGTITSIAEKAGISRSTLHKLMSGHSNPEMRTILSILHILGYDLKITPRRSFKGASAFVPG